MPNLDSVSTFSSFKKVIAKSWTKPWTRKNSRALETTSSDHVEATRRISTEKSKPAIKPILIIKCPSEIFDAYQQEFTQKLPFLDVQPWGHAAREDVRKEVKYAFVSHPEPGRLCLFPKLALTLSAGAAVDHILQDPLYPQQVPIARITSEEAGQRAAEYMLFAVLYLHLKMDHVVLAQRQRRWIPIGPRINALEPTPIASHVGVGILGLGELGQAVARKLVGAGFVVSGWSRTAKDIPYVTSYTATQLEEMLPRINILINLLPSSQATHGLINAERLAKMPRGAAVINAGRASHVVTKDLHEALVSGHISGAVLDVHENEPLLNANPLWDLFDGRALLTPHMATFTSVYGRSTRVVEDIKSFELGRSVKYPYNIESGYQGVGEAINSSGKF